MASIDARKRTDGTTAYRLRWQYGGRRNSPAQSVTYDHPDDGKKMKGAIEARGHLVYDTDPAVLDFSLVTGMRQHDYTAPTFGEVAERYISSRTRASASSRDKYRHTVASRLSALEPKPIEAITDDANKSMLPGGNPCAHVDDIRSVLNEIAHAGGSTDRCL